MRVKLFFPYLTLLLWGLTGHSLFAQVSDQRYVDSMQREIDLVRDPYKKARKMLLLSDFWAYRDTSKAFQQIDNTLKYIGDDKALQGLSLIYKANIIYDTDIPRSQELYLQADELLQGFEDTNALNDRSVLWHNYAALEQLKGNDAAFIQIITEKCIPLAKKQTIKVIWQAILRMSDWH